jgi:hypothetical protein
MQSLKSVLKNKKIQPPDEMAVLKNYILQNYKSTSSIKLSRGALIISVPNAALAATLHLDQQKLIKSCGLQGKKLVFRTGK